MAPGVIATAAFFSANFDCLLSNYKRICNIAGITSDGQHALRHTFATRCIESGVPAVVLKTWLGHTDIHVTLDTYTDVFKSMDNDAINKFDAHLDMM